jgi:hypothetical protein
VVHELQFAVLVNTLDLMVHQRHQPVGRTVARADDLGLRLPGVPALDEKGIKLAPPLCLQLESTLEVVMAAPAREPLFEKIARLPPACVAEVEDFVDFLALRNADRELVHAAAAASVPAFAKVWDNPEDDVYDET